MFVYRLLALIVLSAGLFISDLSRSAELIDSSMNSTQASFKIYESKEISTGDLYAYADIIDTDVMIEIPEIPLSA